MLFFLLSLSLILVEFFADQYNTKIILYIKGNEHYCERKHYY